MKKIIVGNWKMNPDTLEEAKEIFSALKRQIKKVKKTDLVICPPSIFLSALRTKNSRQKSVKLGAQDVFWESKGAFTGQISPEMLKNLGVSHVIVGHSEKRALGETNEIVNKKIKAVLKEGLTLVLCIGESKRDDEGKFFELLKSQIKSAFTGVKKSSLSSVIIAYEPVWAIGKSEREYMKGEKLHQMTIFIRKILSDMYGKKVAWTPKIIYGGSATASNVEDIVTIGRVDGILPGRASLNPKEMKEILEILEEV